MDIKTVEISGIASCFHNLRKPYKKDIRSEVDSRHKIYQHGVYTSSIVNYDEKDMKLLQSLIRRGGEHAKPERLINVTLQITASRAFWVDMDTYIVGVNRGFSEASMSALLKDPIEDIRFDPHTPTHVIENFLVDVQSIRKSIADYPEEAAMLKVRLKMSLPEGYLQTRDINFSYPTLRRIYQQRAGHLLPEFEQFRNYLGTLPLAKELIFID